MKWTKKRIIFVALQAVCYLIAPLIVIWTTYIYKPTNDHYIFKGMISVIILLLFLIWFLKNVKLKSKLEGLSKEMVFIRSKVVDMTEQDKLILNRKRLNELRLIELLLRFISPALIFGGIVLTLQAAEAAIIKLSGALLFIGLFLLAGIVFNVLEIITSKLKNEV